MSAAALAMAAASMPKAATANTSGPIRATSASAGSEARIVAPTRRSIWSATLGPNRSLTPLKSTMSATSTAIGWSSDTACENT